jgi:LysR family hydrogen peroxide-inducible transcriptional activator
MEMHQVRYFLAVCETLNFTRAAERCHVAQPSLTRAIRNLEDELGGPLFRRERRRTHMTDLGRLVQPHLATMLAESEAARSEAQSFAKLDTAPLRLGIMCTIGPSRMISFLARLRARVPAAELTLRETGGRVLVDELMEGALDVAIVALPDLPERFDVHPLFTERYTVAFGPGHRFEGLNAVTLADLDGADYLMRLNCEFPDLRSNHYKLPAPKVNIVYSSEREDWIQAMLAAGIGCAVMPEYLPMLPGIATRPLIEPEMQRTVSLVTVAGRRFPPPLEALIRIARHHPWGAQA